MLAFTERPVSTCFPADTHECRGLVSNTTRALASRLVARLSSTINTPACALVRTSSSFYVLNAVHNTGQAGLGSHTLGHNSPV